MSAFQEVFDDLDAYVLNWAKRNDEIPYEIKTSIIAQIIRTKSIDTNRFIRAVDFREELAADGYRYLIDSTRDNESTYDGFLEFGTGNINAFGVLIEARFNYRDGIRNSRLEPIIDSIADMSFAR